MSDEVAQQLDGGDPCAASESAVRLREAVTEAINDGKVPDVYLEDLSGLVNEIEDQIPECVEPAPPPPPEDDDRRKKNKDKQEEDD
jgi:hypothetical protein